MPGESTTEGKRAQGPANVISLRGHQEAEQALDDLFGAPFGRGHYSAALTRALNLGAPVVAAAVRRLSSIEPDNLLKLGDLLTRFPGRPKAVQAITRAAADPRSPSERRLGALLLLAGLHLDGQADETLYGLPDAAEILSRSLLSLARACAEKAEMCAEYAVLFRFLLSQSPDVLYGVVGVLASQDHVDSRSVLRLLAMHPHPDLADAALEALSMSAAPDTAHDLAVLSRNLPPDLARIAERYLRKRMLSGTAARQSQPTGATGARALLSAIDGSGRRVLWLRWQMGPRAKNATLMLILSDTHGIVGAGATRQVMGVRFPPAGESGPFLWRPMDNSAPLALSTFVDVDREYALGLISDAARLNWLSGTPMPLEYAILMGAIWVGSGAETAGRAEPTASAAEEESPLVENESELLSNPLLEGWYIDSHGVRAVARDVRAIGTPANALTHDNWRILLPALIRLAHDEFGLELRALYARRLRHMSEWFRRSGQVADAEMATSAARTMLQSPPEANLLVLRLLQRGVLMSLGDWG